MNEDWIEMMAYAPLLEDEIDTDYQKAEDFMESEREVNESTELIMSCDTEDYFEATERTEKTMLQKADEAWYSNEEEEDLAGAVMDGDVHDDYQYMPEIPAYVYSDEEY